MKHIIIIIFLLANLNIGFCQDKNLNQKLNLAIEAYEKVYDFSGTVKVVIDNNNTFEKSYGFANRSFEIKNTPDTRFSINSISKTFTATAILILVEEGRIDINAPVTRYIPSLKTSWADSITVHHILTHTSGLPRESGIQSHEELTFKEQVKLVEKQTLLFTPGERYEYSNAGIILLGSIIENVSGMSYETFITKNIIQPLNLRNTGYYSGRNVISNLAVPYRITSDGLEFTQRSKHYGDNAGGGLYSSPSDLFQFVKGLEDHIILSKKYVDMMFQSYVQSGENEFEGYAWSIKYFGNEKLHFAAGSGYGTKSVIVRMPESGDFIGITSNWGNTPILQLLRDLYLTIRNIDVKLPSEDELANPDSYKSQIGTYIFDKEELAKHLGIKRDKILLQEVNGHLFLDDELLAEEGNFLKLTYTNELKIEFNGDKMIINMNGNIIKGSKLHTTLYKR
ncbi:serine hydrolase domain-containing protein [Pontibacter mangrovi]|uniref:Beta-lactamase family protein n=1 Tax=Pontibacter mangrovi TaxID=2589816 RepID=A0A501WA18_9BACT|nr:serine hydrolase domain-containing protein [Pontibacter mangrovi]TPE45325.1 beta-lactamase family protein [Pontibacter mangrovi]